MTYRTRAVIDRGMGILNRRPSHGACRPGLYPVIACAVASTVFGRALSRMLAATACPDAFGHACRRDPSARWPGHSAGCVDPALEVVQGDRAEWIAHLSEGRG